MRDVPSMSVRFVAYKIFLVQVRLRTEVPCTPSSGFEFMTSSHDSTVHVTETPALTTRPSVTLKEMYCHIILEV